MLMRFLLKQGPMDSITIKTIPYDDLRRRHYEIFYD